MNLRSLIVGVVLAAAPAAVHAQIGIYINPVAMHITNSTADTGLYSFLGPNSKAQWFEGVDFGAYYDRKTPFPFKAGVDIRDSLLHGAGAALNAFDVGLRLSGKLPGSRIKPYIEPFVGAGTTRAPFTVLHITRAHYGALAGVDFETKHHVDFRVVEVGYSSLITASSETIGATASIPAANILSVSSGLVFRFP